MPADLASLPEVCPAPASVPRKHRVLIIDDDETLADVLSHGLKQQGFQAVTAYSGGAGLEQARRERPSAIILDLALPDVDGLSICEQLSDGAETCTTPIIILSGKQRPGLVRSCRAAGCHYFLRKPYDPNALLVLIRRAIDEAGRWTGGPCDCEE